MPIDRSSAFFLAAWASAQWSLTTLGLGVWVAACSEVYEPHTRRVEVWSPATGSRSVAPLDRPYDALTITRYDDGRIFLRAQEPGDASPAASFFAWDPKAERFAPAPEPPARTTPPGADAAGRRVVYSSFGRVLLAPANGHQEPVKFYDHGWREIDPIPTSFGEYTALDLSDGGLLLIDEWDTNGHWASLLDPGASHWTDLQNLPLFHPWAYFAAPGGKVALLDEPASRLWDPRTGAVAPLPGPNALPRGAGAASIDESHVLIAGGDSSEKILSRVFLLRSAALAAWLGLGGFGVAWVLRRSRATDEEAAVRRNALRGLWAGLLPAALVVLAVVAGLAFLGSRSMRFNLSPPPALV